MYKSDYIMRTIKQFAETLAALVFNARSNDDEVSYSDLEELSTSFSGLTLDTLTSMNSSQLIGLFSITGELDINKTYASACLLHQLSKQESSEEDSISQKHTALDLLIAIKEKLGEYLNDEHQVLVEELQADPALVLCTSLNTNNFNLTSAV